MNRKLLTDADTHRLARAARPSRSSRAPGYGGGPCFRDQNDHRTRATPAGEACPWCRFPLPLWRTRSGPPERGPREAIYSQGRQYEWRAISEGECEFCWLQGKISDGGIAFYLGLNRMTAQHVYVDSPSKHDTHTAVHRRGQNKRHMLRKRHVEQRWQKRIY